MFVCCFSCIALMFRPFWIHPEFKKQPIFVFNSTPLTPYV